MFKREIELHEKHREKVRKGIARYLLVCSIVIFPISFSLGVLTYLIIG